MEIGELNELAIHAKRVEDSGTEAKLSRLREVLQQQGFFDRPQQLLLIFTEFKDTLDYQVKNLRAWGLTVCVEMSLCQCLLQAKFGTF